MVHLWCSLLSARFPSWLRPPWRRGQPECVRPGVSRTLALSSNVRSEAKVFASVSANDPRHCGAPLNL